MSFDLLIRNGKIVDGTGNPWYKADIGIRDGYIAKISRRNLKDSSIIIDAKRNIVSPGFIDCHSHSQNTILEHPRQESAVKQGITSIVTGNCGAGFAPISESYRDEVIKILKRSSSDPENVVVDWLTLKEWRERVMRNGVGANIIPTTGNEVIRMSVLEPENWSRIYMPNDKEMEEMKKITSQAMEEGSFGLGSRLSTTQRNPALPEEIIELCKVVASYGGVFDIHMRSATNTAIAVRNSVEEIIMIAEKSGVVTNIAHLRNYAGCGKMKEILQLLDDARKRGVEITCDIFPWNYGMVTNPTSLFFEGGLALHGHHDHTITMEWFLDQLRDTEKWTKLKHEMEERYEESIKKCKKNDEELRKHGVKGAWYHHPRFMPLVHSKTYPEYVDLSLDEIADKMGISDWKEATRKILLDDEGETGVSLGAVCEEDLRSVIKYPWSALECDFAHRDQPAPKIRPSHPRGYGSFPKLLEKYVREEKLLTIEEAVRKMTSLSTTWLGINDRGYIMENKTADITIFDPENVRSRANYMTPYIHPEGIEYVIINGNIIIDKGKHTGTIAGKVLKHEML